MTSRMCRLVVMAALILPILVPGERAAADPPPVDDDQLVVDNDYPPIHVDDYGPVGDFSLIERSGREFNSSELIGKIWIADFVFTRCPGPCPILTQKMAGLQQELSGLPDLRLVSITVDPGHDTPEVLSAYARSNGADAARWLFLTGPEATVKRVVTADFRLAMLAAPGSSADVSHSTRFVLVDPAGRIRGFYESGDPRDMRRLRRDAEALSWISWFPPLNASLNGMSGLLLLAGIVFIKRKEVARHRACMMTALGLSTVFLISYLVHHFLRRGLVTEFRGEGWIRPVYFSILISHTTLAVTVPFLAGTTAWLAWKERIEKHKRLAKWTFPIWLYVSVTGVIVYFMLYRL